MELLGTVKSPEDKTLKNFIAMIQGASGVGKSTLLGSAERAGHRILVMDLEDKAAGKYTRYQPEDPSSFKVWMNVILDILEEPFQEDGFVHLTINGQDLAIDTLGIDTLDRLQDLAMYSLGEPGKDTRKYYGNLFGLFKDFLYALDNTSLNVIIVTHVQQKTPQIAESYSVKKKKLEAVEDKGSAPVEIADVTNADDLGYGIYDVNVTSLAGALGRKIKEHMHCILNLVKTPRGESILSPINIIINGVWCEGKDDFGLFKRQNTALEWHDTDAVILNDPLAPLWEATIDRQELVARQKAQDFNDTLGEQLKADGYTEITPTSVLKQRKAQIKKGIEAFVKKYGINVASAMEIIKKHPLGADTVEEIDRNGIIILRDLSKFIVDFYQKQWSISDQQAREVIAPVAKAFGSVSSPKEVFQLTEEALSLLELVVDDQEETQQAFSREEEIVEDVEDVNLDNIPLG